MIKKEAGFSLVELMVTMVIFVFVIASVSTVFTGLLTQFKQQSKIGETNIEGAIGLDILRQDIGSAGYGLPWNVTGIGDPDGDGNFWEHLPNYQEATEAGAAIYNDATRDADGDGNDGEAPRAIVSGNNVGFNGSDYLVIKSISVARNAYCEKWTYLRADKTTTVWTPACENVNKYPNAGDTDCSTGASTNNTVRVIVVSPGTTDINGKSLVVDGVFSDTYANVLTANFNPSDPFEARVIYGVGNTPLRMPFNRADYYVQRPASNMPTLCNPQTRILYKATVNHSDGKLRELPLLDCVADMQVIYWLDMDEDGVAGTYSSADGGIVGGSEGASQGTVKATLADASLLRRRLKEVRVFILAHEGQIDRTFTFNPPTPPSSITVGESGAGSTFDFVARGVQDWQNYRWKVYRIFVKLNNLR